MKSENKSKILVFGIGYLGSKLIATLDKSWEIIAVDLNEDKLKSLKSSFPDINIVIGDASSILTWKKLDLQNVKHIITTIKDVDVSLEVCRIAREVFELDSLINVFLYSTEKEEEFLKFSNINIVKPADVVIGATASLIEKNYKTAINIGLGKGEIVEVNILARSHFVDRKLKYLRPTKWRIAAIYRDENLIIPFGDEKIKIGDKVILIGEPKVLENLVNILIKGIPQFPLQFGTDVAITYNQKSKDTLSEVAYIVQNTKVSKVFIFPYDGYDAKEKDFNLISTKFSQFEIGKAIYSFKTLFKFENNIAFVAIPFKNVSFFEKWQLKSIFEKANKPFLLSRGDFPYKTIIISLNSPDPAYTLEVGIEISRMLKANIQTIFVTMPKELRGKDEEEELVNIYNVVSDFENIYKTSMNLKILEGNPVKESLQFLKNEKNSLVVMSYKKEKISIFNPHIQYLIAKNCVKSMFLIPVEENNE